MPRKKSSFTLIAAIIIMVLMSIVALGVAVYISQGLRYNISSINQERAFYAAQAGVMQAIADYENNGSLVAVTDFSLGDNLYFSFGGSGMFFLADASSPSIVAGRKLKNISMTNLNSTADLTITHMQVSWTPNSGENLISIDLGRGVAEWTGSASSGTNIDMTDFTIPAGTSENDVWLDWAVGADISSLTISVLITFSDLSTVEVVLLNSGFGGAKAITITSTGKVVAPDIYRRTLKAAYDVGTSEIISWEESQDHILP